MSKKSVAILILGILFLSHCSTGEGSNDNSGGEEVLTKELAEKIISENFPARPLSVKGVELSRKIFLEVTDFYVEGFEAKVEYTWKYKITGPDDLVEKTYKSSSIFREYVEISKRIEKQGLKGYVLLKKWDSGWKIEKWLSRLS